MDKSEILEMVQAKISNKIENFESLIAETRASNNDTKSSMGDKYETSREMLQQEINNLQRQLNETIHQQDALKKISADSSTKVQMGALVKTEKGLFYLSVSAGELMVNQQKVMTISTESPLAKAMMGKIAGESFSLNMVNQKIEMIW